MATTQTTTLTVEGMTCGKCAQHVAEALQGVDGVVDVDVQREHNTARIVHDGADVNAMIHAVEEEGYEARVAN